MYTFKASFLKKGLTFEEHNERRKEKLYRQFTTAGKVSNKWLNSTLGLHTLTTLCSALGVEKGL